MRLLDLFCGAGGCSVGYARAGFDVTGVDIEPHKDYPFEMYVDDAIEHLESIDLDEYDVIAASPPCQAFTNAQKIRGNDHPDLITPTREIIASWANGRPGRAYVIENVPGAPLDNPVELCGSMFGLRTYRHRIFESNVTITPPGHPEHVARTAKMGRRPKPDEFMHVVGNFSGVDRGREAMGIHWMTRDDLREAVPPAYTEYIGRQLMNYLVENHQYARGFDPYHEECRCGCHIGSDPSDPSCCPDAIEWAEDWGDD